jgi:hypothetical protein
MALQLIFLLRLVAVVLAVILAALVLRELRPDGLLNNAKQRAAALATLLKRRAQCLLHRHGGASIVIIGLTAWFLFGPLAHAVEGDGPDGPALMDIGVFQTILLAIIRAVALYCFSRLLVKKYMPVVARFLFGHRFVRAFYRLTAWQKVITSLWVLSLFLYLVSQLTR